VDIVEDLIHQNDIFQQLLLWQSLYDVFLLLLLQSCHYFFSFLKSMWWLQLLKKNNTRRLLFLHMKKLQIDFRNMNLY
jgi:hypothetical protein